MSTRAYLRIYLDGMNVCMPECDCMRVHVRKHLSVGLSVCLSVCVYIHASTYVCMYISIHTTYCLHHSHRESHATLVCYWALTSDRSHFLEPWAFVPVRFFLQGRHSGLAPKLRNSYVLSTYVFWDPIQVYGSPGD